MNFAVVSEAEGVSRGSESGGSPSVEKQESSEQDIFSLETVEGRKKVFKSAITLFTEGYQIRTALGFEGARSGLKKEEVEGNFPLRMQYAKLKKALGEVSRKAEEFGGDAITDEETAGVQTKYNALVKLRDRVEAAAREKGIVIEPVMELDVEVVSSVPEEPAAADVEFVPAPEQEYEDDPQVDKRSVTEQSLAQIRAMLKQKNQPDISVPEDEQTSADQQEPGSLHTAAGFAAFEASEAMRVAESLGSVEESGPREDDDTVPEFGHGEAGLKAFEASEAGRVDKILHEDDPKEVEKSEPFVLTPEMRVDGDEVSPETVSEVIAMTQPARTDEFVFKSGEQSGTSETEPFVPKSPVLENLDYQHHDRLREIQGLPAIERPAAIVAAMQAESISALDRKGYSESVSEMKKDKGGFKRWARRSVMGALALLMTTVALNDKESPDTVSAMTKAPSISNSFSHDGPVDVVVPGIDSAVHTLDKLPTQLESVNDDFLGFPTEATANPSPYVSEIPSVTESAVASGDVEAVDVVNGVPDTGITSTYEAPAETVSETPEVVYEFSGAKNAEGKVIDTVSEAAFETWKADKTVSEGLNVSSAQFLSGMWSLIADMEKNPTAHAELTEAMGVDSGDIHTVFEGSNNSVDLQPFFASVANNIK